MSDYSQQQAKHYRKEIRKCLKSPEYFLDTYSYIYDATSRQWVPFRLWRSQLQTLQSIADHTRTRAMLPNHACNRRVNSSSET
jgi:hypothetical protein